MWLADRHEEAQQHSDCTNHRWAPCWPELSAFAGPFVTHKSMTSSVGFGLHIFNFGIFSGFVNIDAPQHQSFPPRAHRTPDHNQRFHEGRMKLNNLCFCAGAEKVRCLVVISCFESINHVWATVWSQIVLGDASFFPLAWMLTDQEVISHFVSPSVSVILALLCLDKVSYYHTWSSTMLKLKLPQHILYIHMQ